MARIKAEAKFPETIMFSKVEPGTSWEGRYLEQREITTKLGRAVNIYVVEVGKDKVEFMAPAVMDARMAQVPIGSYVWLKYDGRITTAKGNSRHEVVVEFDPDGAASQEEIPY